MTKIGLRKISHDHRVLKDISKFINNKKKNYKLLKVNKK